MEHKKPPVGERRQRTADPTEHSMADTGPARTRPDHHRGAGDYQSAHWDQLTGWALPAYHTTGQRQHIPPQKIKYCIPPHLYNESLRYSDGGCD